jgi:PEGA domain-containing protein
MKRAVSRYIFTIGVLLSVSISVSAQRPAPRPPTPPPTPASASSLPSAPAALTVPNPFGVPAGTVDLFQRPDNFHSLRSQPLFFPGATYGPGYNYDPGFYSPMMAVSPPLGTLRVFPRGGLRLETEPRSAQVFADGYYVGIVEDFGFQGRILELTAGPHHIEVRAPGYAMLSFDVTITANETSRFRGDLQSLTPSSPRPAATSASATPKTYYVIPNCYAGDRKPTGALPAGCDITKLRVAR